MECEILAKHDEFVHGQTVQGHALLSVKTMSWTNNDDYRFANKLKHFETGIQQRQLHDTQIQFPRQQSLLYPFRTKFEPLDRDLGKFLAKLAGDL